MAPSNVELGPQQDRGIKRTAGSDRARYKVKSVDKTSPLGVLEYEIQQLLDAHNLTKDDVVNDMKTILNDFELGQTYHVLVSGVKVLKLTSNGDGISIIDHPVISDKKQIVLIPFALPGDVADIKIYKSHPMYVESDLVKVTQPSEFRNDELINCKYFGKCGGCQYQNVSYSQALEFKRMVIENAYKFFAPQLFKILPAINETEPSPLTYGYRTKLTPHFNIPNAIRTDKSRTLDTRPSLGFGAKGRPKWRETAGGDASIVDIEDCPIGTPIINIGMSNERRKFEDSFTSYKRGATILLREQTQNSESAEFDSSSESAGVDNEISKLEVDGMVKTCVTNPRHIVTEFVNGFQFKFSAGEFFQNNNSILPAVTDYVKANLNLASDSDNYLVDAYCGSGLFSITCSTNVKRVIGVEVSADSVKFARLNAELNKIQNASFIAGKAEEIFKDIDLPADKTSVILDPPRKGCDDVFLNQLSDFHPAKIVYISCNVHSQARDVEWFIHHTENGHHYEVVSVKGFDFFPQTHHVESVAVLRLKNGF
ncbi:hypothetical protein CANTEDRAFT_114235 [Yamadazyma tenuis ATCC 10573]|uniref:tRNA (uracil(54)-C(5))-methyltransferase n=1 Tax=Candida tenuis (strain ATCC 10573 / BCRC 21748 / CBS 615 / JCM 9827 / NBRC 10315 / NRRL Y-1498 / VKM Y-70) TaxID=590646 RepID=G3B3J6_CANTC|nr:uncharacterized protein CANTEDRAFT_114235 [Yamadazyma tenuis ATCC 10573]EGV64410.1 hypothetical protein CANTEDRAFT_114235 [Yamadazyma tenuis ATCC 10573]